MGMLAEVSGARMREEVLDILDEPAPGAAVARLDDLGALGELLPAGAAAAGVATAVTAAAEAVATLSVRFGDGFAPDRLRALFAVLATTGAPRSTAKWLRHLHAGRVMARGAQEASDRGPATLRALEAVRGLRDSRLYRMLHPLSAETLTLLWMRAGALGRERIERFLGELAGVRIAVNGSDLIAMGATPSDAFSAILARALDDRLDGRAVGREAEIANLRRLATRAGLVGHRKEPG